MKEYIECEKVLELIGNFKRDDVTEHCVNYAAGWNEALEQIECNIKEDISAADVHPVVHGEWIINSDGYYPYCSECGKEPKNGVMSDYCPHCGAKMDGKDGESK